MVSSWWLLWTFLAGGYAGFLLFAMLNVSHDTRDDERDLSKARRRDDPRGALKEGV
jgi:hypothetical protein